jgi:hypothetical protein
MTPLTAADMLAEIRDWAETLPTRCPTILRVGPGVREELNGGVPITRPLIEPPLPLGVDIVEDDTYPPGQWRIFDQWDEEISAGVIPVPGATIRVKTDDGLIDKDMHVLLVSHDDEGRMAGYTVVDPTLLDFDLSSHYFGEPRLFGRWSR